MLGALFRLCVLCGLALMLDVVHPLPSPDNFSGIVKALEPLFIAVYNEDRQSH